MTEIKFYDSIEDEKIKYVVIVSRFRGKWLLCKHRRRETFEYPGGHREEGEDPAAAAHRELYEETGAVEYRLRQICAYSVTKDGREPAEDFGMLYYCEITGLGPIPKEFEMERVELFDELPDNMTYPAIQPCLMKKVEQLL